MKILAISCSPRSQGNTEILLNEALQGAQQDGAEVELYSVVGKNIAPCLACRACVEEGVCVQKDDMQGLFDKMLEADGIILGTPVHVYTMASQCKTIMERTTSLRNPERSLANKVGGIVVTAGSLGCIGAVKDLYFYMATRRMLPVNYIAAYGLNKGDVKSLEQCLKATRNLGRLMVAVVKMNFRYPLELMGMPIGYGTWTK